MPGFASCKHQLVLLQVGKLRLPFTLGNLCSSYFHWDCCPWQRYKYLITVTAQSSISLVPGISNLSKRNAVLLSIVSKAWLKMGPRSPKKPVWHVQKRVSAKLLNILMSPLSHNWIRNDFHSFPNQDLGSIYWKEFVAWSKQAEGRSS